PIGAWLVAGPAWLGLALARMDGVWRPVDLLYLLLMGVGAIAMRGAGCTFNDIVDKDLDAQVARTASRPLPAGTVTLKQAWAFSSPFVGESTFWRYTRGMNLEPFLLEHWLAAQEPRTTPIRYNLAVSTGPRWTLGQLAALGVGLSLDDLPISYAHSEGDP